MTDARERNSGTALAAWVRALERTTPIARTPTRTLPTLIRTWAEHHGDSPALCSRSVTVTYGDLAAMSDAYACWGLGLGLGERDVVCLQMENRPEYLAIWLGLTRIGVTVALLNTSLGGELLAHSIRTVGPRCLITSSKLAESLRTIRSGLGNLALYELGGGESGPSTFEPLEAALDPYTGSRPDESRFRLPTLRDRALLIYTSGTTGLPKAANVSHFRLMQWSHWFAGLMDVRPQDRMYNCLPLYHSVGGVVACGATLVGGGAVVLRERFSASSFWQDVRAERCTLFQYIGELCRYLLNAAPQPEEQAHSLRLACGNGLRGDVWEAFQGRFRIPQILEYYASTEGNFSLYNCEGRPGAIGRIPAFLAHRLPVALVKFDPDTEAPQRDALGRCVRCATDEVGEAIGEILDDQAGTRFEGYTDKAASERKTLADVFRRGDRWYRTGDLMRRDAQGFYYFVDRVGDTFRWKGENVSTTEVAAVVGACPGVRDVAVYGVAVPNSDGRAGMAALVVGTEFSLEHFRTEVSRKLPPYARPVFVRILAELELTGTFKLRKQELMREGYDPVQVRDPVFFNDEAAGLYAALDARRYGELQAGKIRL